LTEQHIAKIAGDFSRDGAPVELQHARLSVFPRQVFMAFAEDSVRSEELTECLSLKGVG